MHDVELNTKLHFINTRLPSASIRRLNHDEGIPFKGQDRAIYKIRALGTLPCPEGLLRSHYS